MPLGKMTGQSPRPPGGAALHPVLPPSRRTDPRLPSSAGWQPIAARRAAQCRGALHRFGRGGGGDRRPRRARGRAGGGARDRRCGRGQCGGLAGPALAQRRRGARYPSMPHGATHFLVSPFSEQQLLHASMFAQPPCRAGRAGSRRGRPLRPARADRPRGAGSRARRTVELSPALARKAGLGEEQGRRISLMDAVPQARSGRPPRRARSAVDRLLATGERHRLRPWRPQDGGRGSPIMSGVAGADGEWSAAPRRSSAGASRGQSRDPLTGLRDARAARAWIEEQLAGRRGPRRRWSCCCSRSAASTRSTPPSAAPPAMRCCRRRRGGSSGMSTPTASAALVARMAGAEFAVLLGAPTSLDEGRFLAGQLVEAIGAAVRVGRPCHHARQPGRRGRCGSRRRSRRACCAAPAPRWPRRRAGEGRRSACSRPARQRDARAATSSRSTCAARSTRTRSRYCSSRRWRSPAARIVGVEALARWRHPLYGELGALTLFSVAERSDYLVQLSDHVQRKAIAGGRGLARGAGRARAWRSTSPPPTSSGPASPRSFSRWSTRAASRRPAHRRGDRKRADRGSRRRRATCSPGCATAACGSRSTISAPAIRASPI